MMKFHMRVHQWVGVKLSCLVFKLFEGSKCLFRVGDSNAYFIEILNTFDVPGSQDPLTLHLPT